MRSHPDRELLFQDAMARIGSLSPSEGTDVFLHYFMSVLGGMDLSTARKMRDELSNRFGGRHCSQRLCTAMIDLLNGHLSAGLHRNVPDPLESQAA
ncbi:hypothetical protein [Horticoccus sp. 23ND18S-11]|uniref:hypothetical protein n=1 Tax=Horticoccus sp. 23ND18S-11 TaxID=3391832 RepID=UPI0039C93867